MMHDAVDGRSRRHWVFEDAIPLREQEVARDDDRLPLVPRGQERE
jgi:hypothetical protein